jgi:hypothetical protein
MTRIQPLGGGRGEQQEYRGPACEFLGIRSAHGTVHDTVHEGHRCFWGRYRLRPTLAHQAEFCLLNRVAECPIPQSLAARPEGYRQRSSEDQDAPPLWKRLMGRA